MQQRNFQLLTIILRRTIYDQASIPLQVWYFVYSERVSVTEADAGGYKQWEAAEWITIYIDYVSWPK